MAKGFAYLVAILDLYSRKVLSFRVSNAHDARSSASRRWRRRSRATARPEIFNTDQGSQFTAEDFTNVLLAKGVRVSMDGKGRWVDKAYVSHCTSFARSETIPASGRLSESLVPCALRGESAPGGSYRHSFLSL